MPVMPVMPDPSRRRLRVAVPLMLTSLLPMVACAGDPAPVSAGDSRAAALAAVSEGAVVLEVRGMACPKCVTNADLQLLKLPGVSRVRIDMRHGLVEVSLDGSPPPTRAAFEKAIDDAGLTLVEVHGLPGADA